MTAKQRTRQKRRMISEAMSRFPGAGHDLRVYSIAEDQTSSKAQTQITSSLLYNLSILRDKVHQVESAITLFLSQHQVNPDSSSLAISSMNSLIQDLIFTASSMLLTPPETAPSGSNPCSIINMDESDPFEASHGREFHPSETMSLNWCAPGSFNNGGLTNRSRNYEEKNEERQNLSPMNEDVIEFDVAHLLAKYTHYCRVCGKGFKRDANLRMHMRAHGEEYKTSAALSNPKKNNEEWKKIEDFQPKKYSCPQAGCRWNKKHPKFQPLKSIICVKNHYKRSHCPKMYVCKRCNRKQFSVLSDLRTHEKHCGDLKWQCSCGTTFSRKDKLVGHVALFVGHSPLMSSRRSETQTTNLQQDHVWNFNRL